MDIGLSVDVTVTNAVVLILFTALLMRIINDGRAMNKKSRIKSFYDSYGKQHDRVGIS